MKGFRPLLEDICKRRCVWGHACCEESEGFMGPPWARSEPVCAEWRARVVHCLMLRPQQTMRRTHHRGEATLISITCFKAMACSAPVILDVHESRQSTHWYLDSMLGISFANRQILPVGTKGAYYRECAGKHSRVQSPRMRAARNWYRCTRPRTSPAKLRNVGLTSSVWRRRRDS